jgi:hypothetical protein
MIPEGPIYQHIRSAVLASFPDKCKAAMKSRVTFSDWLLRGTGSYHVQTVLSKEFTIAASPFDISSALLTDVECLSNHCFEQLQELSRFYVDKDLRSDAWSVVTIYYLGFFTAQALLTLIGSPVIFIDKPHMKRIRSLGPSTSANPGPGSYYLDRVNPISATFAEYTFKKSKQQVHDAIWKRLFQYFTSLVDDPLLATLSSEVLFYDLLTTNVLHGAYQSHSWPSTVRIKANYSPGFAYLLVENADTSKTKRLLNHWQVMDEAQLLLNLRTAVAGSTPGTKTDFAEHVRLLHDITQSLFFLSRKLYGELLERKEIDKTWEQRRRQFRERMSFPAGKFTYILND